VSFRRICIALPIALAVLIPVLMPAPGQGEEMPPPAKPPVFFVMMHAPGPKWVPGTPFREQPGIPEHVGYMHGLQEKGLLEMGGPFLDDSGGMMVSRAASREEVVRLAEADPAVKSGLLAVTVKPWMQVMRADPPQETGALIRRVVTVEVSLAEAWKAWTSSEGCQTFFAPRAQVEAKVGGAYEMRFDPSQPEGTQGSEGCRILALEPMRLLSFSWNAPPHLPNVRKERTRVTLRFEELAPNQVRIILTHDGWGEGPEWDEAFAYFSKVWGVVLKHLALRFRTGPIDWAKLMKGEMEAKP